MPKKMTKKQREIFVTRACIRAVVGYAIPMMSLSAVSKAAGQVLDAGGDPYAMVVAARAACETVGTRTDQWSPLPGEAPEVMAPSADALNNLNTGG